MSQSSDLVSTAEEQYNKLNLPPLPDSVTELLVTFAPWISLLFALLGLIFFIPGILFLLVFSPVAAIGGAGIGYIFTIIHLILDAAGAVVSLMAFGGLRRRSLRGWTLMFWATAIYLVAGLLPLSIGGLISVIISAAIAFYLLFQTKPYYDGRRVVPASA